MFFRSLLFQICMWFLAYLFVCFNIIFIMFIICAIGFYLQILLLVYATHSAIVVSIFNFCSHFLLTHVLNFLPIVFSYTYLMVIRILTWKSETWWTLSKVPSCVLFKFFSIPVFQSSSSLNKWLTINMRNHTYNFDVVFLTCSV